MKRQAITERMKVQSLLSLGGIRCPECGGYVLPDDTFQWDHRAALIHDGKHEFTNVRPVHTECHKRKTARDIKANAKVKRIARGGKTKSGRKIASRSFDKTKTKHMDGRVSIR